MSILSPWSTATCFTSINSSFKSPEIRLVQVELSLQGPIRETLVLLEPVNDLGENVLEGHDGISTTHT